jgi:hypothetical protein
MRDKINRLTRGDKMNYYLVYTRGGNVVSVISSWYETAMEKVSRLYGYSMDELVKAEKCSQKEADACGKINFGI